MAVITISREYGSGGNHIASLLCDRLGYRFFDRNLIEQLGTPESLQEMLDEAHLETDVHDAHGTLWRLFRALQTSSALDELPVQVVERHMHRAYDDDNVVVVGRGGQMVLRGLPDALHVRVMGPLGKRIEAVAQFDGLPPDAARERTLGHDRLAAAYVRHNYRVDLSDPTLYDLIINTERVSWDAAADMIEAALKRLPSRPSAGPTG